jgi:uncharacterized protein
MMMLQTLHKIILHYRCIQNPRLKPPILEQDTTDFDKSSRFGCLKHELKESTVLKICEIFTRYPQVEKAVLYGSRAKGNYETGSDIDLTLDGGAGLNMDILYPIMDNIDELYLPYSFDISILRDIHDPDMIEHIRRVGVVFYKRKDVKTPESDADRDVRYA